MRLPPIRPSLERFMARQPAGIRKFLQDYHRSLDREFRSFRGRPYPWTDMPYWRILPVMLARGLSREGGAGSMPRGFLRDVRWGQYCLYLGIRFQDDLFDGQAGDRVAVYAADVCFAEAGRVFSRYLATDPWFWRVYHNSLHRTAASIVAVDGLQRRRRPCGSDLLNGYADVAAILAVGTAAACAVFERRDLFPRLSRFCREMAKAGQILDDLLDIQEDLQRGRRNFAALLSPPGIGHGGKAVRRKNPLIETLCALAVSERVREEVRVHLSRAAVLAGGLPLPGMPLYLGERINSLKHTGRKRPSFLKEKHG